MTTSLSACKVGRARRDISRLWQVPMFLLGLCALLGVAVSSPWRHSRQEQTLLDVVHTLRRGLQQDYDGDWLVTQAEEALARLPTAPSRAAEVHFLAGSAYYRQAVQKPAPLARALWPHAAEHLDKAAELGVPDADQPALHYRLGCALYYQGADLLRAVELLTQGVEKGAEQPLFGYRLLVEANLRLPTPNVDGALAANRRVLDLTVDQDIQAVASARLQRGELLLRKELAEEALLELQRIDKQAPSATRIKARLLQAHICEENQWWSKAAPFWQALVADGTQVEGGRARIAYALGRCWAKAEPANDAEAIRAWSDALRLGGPAGQAAGLRLGELRLRQDDKNALQALADWRAALAKVTAPSDFRNPYIELAEVRTMFDRALSRFQDQQDAQKTQELADLYRKIAPGGVAEKQLAQAAEAFAQQMLDKPGTSAASAQGQFRKAADAYERAAVAAAEADRSQLLWRSALCARSGKDANHAVKMLHQFVALEKNESRLADAWNMLGDLYRAQGKKAPAREAYNKCIEYPNTPFAYSARYHLALEAMDAKDFEKARAILKQNLEGDLTEIDRHARERSLYTMATLLMQMKNYSEARIYLKDALVNFPENRDALQARRQLGECCCHLARAELAKERQLEKKILGNTAPELRASLEASARLARQTRRNWLGEGLQIYQHLADDLHRQALDKPLSANELVALRRALFGIGECHRDSGNLPEAQRAFRHLQLQHRRTLEALYAGLSACNLAEEFHPSSKQAEAARTLAKEALKVLQQDVNDLKPDDAIFHVPGVPARMVWLSMIDTTHKRLYAPPRSDKPLPNIR